MIAASNQLLPTKKSYIKRTYITLVKKDDFNRQKHFFFQRMYRGFDSSELWSLDSEILKYLVPRLERFAKACKGDGWPIIKNNEMVYLKAETVMQRMLRGFRLMKKHIDDTYTFSEKEQGYIKKSFNCFKKHFYDLWI